MANLLRLAILVLLVWLGWRLVRRWLAAASPPAVSKKHGSQKVERMVRCRYCDLHLPEQEALHDGRDWYCNAAHRDADRENRTG